MTGSFQLLATTLTSALVMGVLPALGGKLRAQQDRVPELPANVIDRLAKVCLFVAMPLLFVAGWMVDRWGAHDVLFGGSVMSGLAVAALSTRLGLESMRWLVVLIAAAGACMAVATTAAMPRAFLGPDDPTSSLNLGFIVVAIGYLVLSPLTDALCRRLGFRTGMLMLAVFCLLPAGFVIVTSRKELPAAVADGTPSPLVSPAVWLAAATAIFCFPLEGSLRSWTAGYLKNLGRNPRQVASWQTGFWTIFLASRFITGQYLVSGYELWFVLVLVAVSAVTLGNLAGAYGPTSARGLFVLAASFGPLMPSLLGAIIRLAPEPGLALATVYACGGAGTLILMPALAASNQSNSMQAGMHRPLIITLLMAIPALALALTSQ